MDRTCYTTSLRQQPKKITLLTIDFFATTFQTFILANFFV